MNNEWHGPNHVAVCIPYYRCRPYIRRAVKSILTQSHRNLTLVVVNDADYETPPWPELADIRDSRLVRFDMLSNQSLYFANSVVLNAVGAPYFLVQDADDWSHPDRLRLLLASLQKDRADIAFGSEVQFRETPDGTAEILGVRYQQRLPYPNIQSDNQMQQICTLPGRPYRFRITHHALFRSASLQELGGYYAGMRQHFDTLLTNLLLLTGRVSHIPQPLYWRMHWPGALTRHPKTRFGTTASKNGLETGAALYAKAYESYQQYLSGKRTASQLLASIRNICRANIPDEQQALLQMEVGRLKELLLKTANQPTAQILLP